jgi:uncharacterized protein (TIGR00288 family)
MNDPNARRYHVAQTEPATRAPHAALLIDFDNVTMGIRSDLQSQLRRLMNSEIIKGKVSVQRAYADWRRYPQYIVPLSEASIDLIFAPAFGSNKKNATDIRLAIDALEIVFTRPEIGTFILLSGDSDFSSLVLKLKEYGKYVIGVGIRESSSDLLVQNCDEYYGYNELTGLTKESDIERVSRDPWELVVEAISQMKRDDDVMRSDRLKQVMQSIYPKFDEKDSGFSRFSKFIVEASQRGLLKLQKLDNGQFAIDLGENANVPPGEEAELRKPAGGRRDAGGRSRRKRAPRRRQETDERSRQLTLGDAFELLRRSLLALGAVGEEATNADAAREKMVELLGSESDPVFERPRFQRLMRQAHDADIIELVKSDGDGYMLKLTARAEADGAIVAQAGAEPEAEAKAEAEVSAEPEQKTRAKRSRATTRKASKSGERTPRSRSKRAAKPAASETEQPEAKAAPAQPAESETTKPAPKRNPRYRRGSRGGRSKRAEAPEKTGAATPSDAPAAESGSAPESRRSRGGGGRGGGGRRGGARSESGGGEEPEGGAPKAPARETSRPAESESAAQAPGGDVAESGGLLRRMTAALKKVVEGPDAEK